MPEQTVLRNVISFFERIGIYDVVLPFLLVFTIIFAVFEKSRILGTETIDGKKYTKKNLNSMAAFVVAFLVVASSQLVEVITQISANIVVLVLLGVFFLLLVGTFYKPAKEGEPLAITDPWLKNTFTIIMFIGIVFIFLAAIKTRAGTSWLQEFIDWLGQFWTSAAVASIILIIVLIIFIVWITRPEKTTERTTGQEGGTP